jgi:DNA polymerase-3 subunit gamma/tau
MEGVMAFAIYRRFRPKKISELIGQESVSEVISNSAKNGKISHAYLFYGPRGCGKTSAARILAKLANCEKRNSDPEFMKEGEPCNECPRCKEIDEGRALDVVEIDAASNRGIDEIRELKEGARLSPSVSARKVFIIDEVHQLTKEAFNALLKTLEEPPSHVMFILATTEYDKLPATIVSRTQRFSFKRVSVVKIIEKLKMIAETEGINISDEALEVIASAAEGSFRDAESLFEQVVSMEDKEITLAEVERILGKAGSTKTEELAGRIISGDLPGALEALSSIDEAGYNLTQLTKDLIHYLRRVLVSSYDPKMSEIFKSEMTSETAKRIEEHAKVCDKEKTINTLKALIKAYGEMKYSPFAIIPLEVAIVESLKNKNA